MFKSIIFLQNGLNFYIDVYISIKGLRLNKKIYAPEYIRHQESGARYLVISLIYKPSARNHAAHLVIFRTKPPAGNEAVTVLHEYLLKRKAF